ncbi:MAG: DUF2780 domain-containing protein [Verrucomicrobia bacterium]|nr:DUF2780 domain-containing protein [Verrucomicrobiota bacterium]
MDDLIAELVGQLGVDKGQASGGVGLLFKLAQNKLGGDFSQVTAALPGVLELIKKAPETGGAAKLIGGLMGAMGGKGQGLSDLASLAGGLAKLNLDPKRISEFVPVILRFVKSKAGANVVDLLAKALKA